MFDTMDSMRVVEVHIQLSQHFAQTQILIDTLLIDLTMYGNDSLLVSKFSMFFRHSIMKGIKVGVRNIRLHLLLFNQRWAEIEKWILDQGSSSEWVLALCKYAHALIEKHVCELLSYGRHKLKYHRCIHKGNDHSTGYKIHHIN